QFGKGKRARDGEPSIVFAHWLAKHRCREKVDTDCGHPTAAQIRNEHEFVRELSATLKHADRVVITKMMKRQGAENDVVWLRVTPKPAIELPDIFKIPLQFRGNRLRTVHQLELDWIKLPLH